MAINLEKVEQAINKSSLEIRDLLFSSEVGYELEGIAEENKLEEDKYLQLVDEVGYVILGLKQRFSFNNSLVEIGIDKNKSLLIEKKIEQEIFSKLDKVKTPSTPQKTINPTAIEQKIGDVANKYSLGEEKKKILVEKVLSSIKSSQKMSSGQIMSEIGVSSLLAEQIMNDLNTRVFEYALNIVEGQKLKVELDSPKSSVGVNVENSSKNSSKQLELVARKIGISENNKLPEIAPVNLPMERPGDLSPDKSGFAKTFPAKEENVLQRQLERPETQTYKPTLASNVSSRPDLGQERLASPDTPSRIIYKSSGNEPVQKPVSVPRFIPDNKSEEEPVSPVAPTTPTPKNIIDSKLTSTMKGGESKPVEKTPSKYSSDPYREPLE